MGKSIGLFQKKIKEGQNYYPKFSISHFFQNFQHFFYLMNNRKKPSFQCWEWNKSLFNPYVLLKTNLFERRILPLVHKKKLKKQACFDKNKVKLFFLIPPSKNWKWRNFGKRKNCNWSIIIVLERSLRSTASLRSFGHEQTQLFSKLLHASFRIYWRQIISYKWWKLKQTKD